MFHLRHSSLRYLRIFGHEDFVRTVLRSNGALFRSRIVLSGTTTARMKLANTCEITLPGRDIFVYNVYKMDADPVLQSIVTPEQFHEWNPSVGLDCTP